MKSASLHAVLIGTVAPLHPQDPRPSGIDKHPVQGPLWAGRYGLRGDAQADLEAHGGPDKAVHQYASDHYPAWREELPDAALRLSRLGAFGENLATSGWTEHDVCLGDVVQVGRVKLEVSHGRQPCWKLNVRFGAPDMVRRVTQSLRCGWYYRVLEEGLLEAGQPLELVDRPLPHWTIARLFGVLFGPGPGEHRELETLLTVPVLADAWKVRARKRLR